MHCTILVATIGMQYDRWLLSLLQFELHLQAATVHKIYIFCQNLGHFLRLIIKLDPPIPKCWRYKVASPAHIALSTPLPPPYPSPGPTTEDCRGSPEVLISVSSELIFEQLQVSQWRSVPVTKKIHDFLLTATLARSVFMPICKLSAITVHLWPV